MVTPIAEAGMRIECPAESSTFLRRIPPLPSLRGYENHKRVIFTVVAHHFHIKMHHIGGEIR